MRVRDMSDAALNSAHGFLAVTLAILAFMALAAAPSWGEEHKAMKRMGGMMAMDAPVVPAVTGYSEGEEILFLHTETSDPEIARVLTDTMGSPVLVVPSLAEVAAALLAKVYVFRNGVQPDGPRGPLEFQPDVFAAPPGHRDYTPLRLVVLVNWQPGAAARVLKSAAEVERAQADGELAFEETGIVVNMPMLTWPGGRR